MLSLNVISMFGHPLLLRYELLFYPIDFLLQEEFFLECFLLATRFDLLLEIRFLLLWLIINYTELFEQTLSSFIFVPFEFFQHFLLVFSSDFVQLFLLFDQFEDGTLFFRSFYFSFLLSGFQLLSAHFIKPFVVFLVLQVLVLFLQNRYLCPSACLSCIVAFVITFAFIEITRFGCCCIAS